jgi:acetyltransferase-like isoleucine patch superfamily enzyme
MKKTITLLIILFLPSFLIRPLLRVLGHTIGKKVTFGFSIIKANKLSFGDFSKIGHFNLILNQELILMSNCCIKHFNILKGPFSLILKDKARIANQNYITRAKKGITYGKSKFELGFNSNITSMHFIDLTKNVIIGDETVLGGRHSQIWTHGYIHDSITHERIRIDGDVIIGNDVYFGSKILINPGVTIKNGVSVGGGGVISKNLNKQGMYVNQELRFIETNLNQIKSKLTEVKHNNLVEKVYTKN